MKAAARRRSALMLGGAGCLVAAVLAASIFDMAFAQVTPLGMSGPPQPTARDGLLGWIFLKQAEFYRGLSAAIRQAKADGDEGGEQ